MTDELTPEREAAVRRLLAEARHEGPVPEHVEARLDEVLAGLLAERLPAEKRVDDLHVLESTGSVTELAGVRRRRRNAGRLLLAAAVVIVGGVAVGQTLGDIGLDAGGGDSSSAGGSLDDAPDDNPNRNEADAQAGAESNDTGGAKAPDAAGSVTSGGVNLLNEVQVPVPLTSEDFAADVRRELARTAIERRQAANAGFDGLLAYVSQDSTFVCADGVYGDGATLPAYYDAEEAVLVLRRPRSGIQRVDLLTCGTAVRLDSVELSAR